MVNAGSHETAYLGLGADCAWVLVQGGVWSRVTQVAYLRQILASCYEVPIINKDTQ